MDDPADSTAKLCRVGRVGMLAGVHPMDDSSGKEC